MVEEKETNHSEENMSHHRLVRITSESTPAPTVLNLGDVQSLVEDIIRGEHTGRTRVYTTAATDYNDAVFFDGTPDVFIGRYFPCAIADLDHTFVILKGGWAPEFSTPGVEMWIRASQIIMAQTAHYSGSYMPTVNKPSDDVGASQMQEPPAPERKFVTHEGILRLVTRGGLYPTFEKVTHWNVNPEDFMKQLLPPTSKRP